MKEFKSLVLLQLKDKLNFSSLNTLKKKIFRIVFSILKVMIITCVIFAGFYILSVLRLFSLLPGIPLDFFTIIFSLMFVLSIIVAVNGLVQNLYLSKDNFSLLSFPVSRTSVFLSKFVVYFIYEFIRNLTYLMPVLIAYFMINGCAWFYYIWLIPALIIYTMFVLTTSALLSIPTLFIVNYINNRQWLKLVVLCGIIASVVLIIIRLILLIPENFDIRASWGTTFWKIQDFMKNYSERTWVFRMILVSLVGIRYGVSNQLFVGEQWLSLGIVLLAILIMGATTYFLIRPLFFRMASSGFEHKKDEMKRMSSNKKYNVYVSLIKKEFLLTYRDSDRFYPLILTMLFLPLSILLLNKIYGAMDTRLTGNNMTIAFNVLIIMLIALSSSVAISKVLSMEGASAYINKITPQSYLTMLSSKTIINAVTFSISILISSIIFGTFARLGRLNIIVMFLMLECVYLGHLLYSAELDIMNPQTWEYSATGTHSYNRNESKSGIMATILSAIFAFLTFFFVSENSSSVWWKLLFVSACYLTLRIYLYVSKIKFFYKEK